MNKINVEEVFFNDSSLDGMKGVIIFPEAHVIKIGRSVYVTIGTNGERMHWDNIKDWKLLPNNLFRIDKTDGRAVYIPVNNIIAF